MSGPVTVRIAGVTHELLGVFLLVYCLTTGAWAQVSFGADKLALERADRVEFQWNAKDASAVYLLGSGKVAVTGSIAMAVDRTTTYTLVADTPSGTFARHLTVEVRGGRGIEYPPDSKQFAYPLTFTKSIRSRAAFVYQMHDVLQNGLGFSVQPSGTLENVISLTTNLSDRSDLVDKNERSIRARRIAHHIDIQGSAASSQDVQYTILTLIEFQRRAERSWTKDENEALYRSAARSVAGKIKQMADGQGLP